MDSETCLLSPGTTVGTKNSFDTCASANLRRTRTTSFPAPYFLSDLLRNEYAPMLRSTVPAWTKTGGGVCRAAKGHPQDLGEEALKLRAHSE